MTLTIAKERDDTVARHGWTEAQALPLDLPSRASRAEASTSRGSGSVRADRVDFGALPAFSRIPGRVKPRLGAKTRDNAPTQDIIGQGKNLL
ncbi:hypothetical protein [Mycobacterium sp. NPDC050853]|uniref:hypothetical protein n=1 Tax=Mycobacterium sp. NPDC050853 TaxID=3155160 RepID=UPI0033EECCC4